LKTLKRVLNGGIQIIGVKVDRGGEFQFLNAKNEDIVI
jgi:hypothetical protein